MKKILVMIAAALMMVSCSSNQSENSNNDNIYSNQSKLAIGEMVTLTYHGESHEYIETATSGGFPTYAHWAGCKYCKNDSVK